MANLNLFGKGLGPQFIKEFMQTILFAQDQDIEAVIVDPDPKNKSAIRCYEKVGFKNLGQCKAPWGPAEVMIYYRKLA